MIDNESIVESLIQASKDSEEVFREKTKVILALALKKQCEEIVDVIYEYQNQWSKTSNNIYSESNDSTTRIIKLLFNLIINNVGNIKEEYNKILENKNI